MYKASLCFAPAGIDACAFWRMWVPHLNVPHSRFMFTEGMPDLNEMVECDAVVVQRLMTDQNIKFLQIARAFGLKIIYDLDDNVWDLPKSNPAYNVYNDPKSKEGMQACAEWADAITVSTKQLRRVVMNQYAGLCNVSSGKEIPIVHIDNCIDLNLFKPTFLPKDPDKVVIGWGGSNTHYGDVAVIWNMLPSILEEHKNVQMEFVGQDPPFQIRNHPRVKIRPWCHIGQYHNRFALWNWDIVLAPLEYHKFNHSKSCIKMIEAGAIRAPILAQAVPPYEYFCSFKPKISWQLCFNFDWKRKLYELIKSKAMREDFGELNYRNVKENFNIKRTVPQWQDLAQRVIT